MRNVNSQWWITWTLDELQNWRGVFCLFVRNNECMRV